MKRTKAKIVIVLSLIYLLLIFAHGFASSFTEGKVSLKLQNTPLSKALKILSEQAKVDIVYADNLVENISVTCELENKSCEEALKQILRDTPVNFISIGNQVVLLARTGESKVVIRGQVLDHETGLPLEAVNVFLANTMIGSSTNDDGEYVIRKVPFGTFDLIISRIGYAVQKHKIVVSGSVEAEFDFRLTPRPYQAPEITVTAEDMKKWRKNLKKFTKVFFSTTQNASECKILNPFVLDFTRKKGGVLTAAAHEPLRIENRALGYRIEYILEKFEATSQVIRNAGIPRFEELIPETLDEERKWKRNRIRAYKGSVRHFLSTLCRNYDEHAGDPQLLFDPQADQKRKFPKTIGKIIYVSPAKTDAVLRRVMKHVLDEGFRVVMVQDPWSGKNDPVKGTRSTTIHSVKLQKIAKAERVNTNRFLSAGKAPLERILRYSYYLEVRYVDELEENNYLDYAGKYGEPSAQRSLIILNVDSLTIDTSGHFYNTFGMRVYDYWSWERMADRLPWDYTAATAEADAQALAGMRSN